MASWYISISGRTQGPKTDAEVKALLLSGDLGMDDPIFEVGATKWKSVRDFELFTPSQLVGKQESAPAFAISSQTRASSAPIADETTQWEIPEDELQQQWIVLSRKGGMDGDRFLPVGPFNLRQVSERIQQGAFNYNDHAWRPGLTNWLRLGDFPEFSGTQKPWAAPAVQATSPSSPLNPEPAEDYLSAVQTLEPKPTSNPAPMFEISRSAMQAEPYHLQPEPLQGEVITPLKSTPPETVNSPEPSIELKPEPSQEPVKFKESGRRVAALRRLRPSSPRTRLAMMFASLAIVFVGMHALLDNYEFVGLQSEDEATAPAATATTQAAVEVAPAQIVISLKPLKTSISEVQVAIETNASSDHPIRLAIRGQSGQVLRDLSYFRRVEMRRRSGELPILDMSSWNLAAGWYAVEAEVSGTTAVTAFFVGQEDDSFKAELKRHRKRIAARQQTEKFTLLHVLAMVGTDAERGSAEKVEDALEELQRLQESASQDGTAFPELIESLVATLANPKDREDGDRNPASGSGAVPSLMSLRQNAALLSGVVGDQEAAANVSPDASKTSN